MKSITIKVDIDTLIKMKIFYEADLKINNNPHALFIAKIEGCTITGYNSKKVLFQGDKAEYEASIWGHISSEQKTLSEEIVSDYYLESIGSDEVGTGDYFGPVVVVSAYLNENNVNLIKTLKIDDSKKLTDTHIQKIAPSLFKNIPYSLLIVDNEKYNNLMNQKDMNLNKLKALLHKQAISNLLKKINQFPEIIIDQFCSVAHFYQYINDETFTKNINFHTKAESKFASVACASIMARYIFLQEIDKLSKSLNTTLVKGASNLVDKKGKELVEKYGQDILRRIAKLHFKNTDKIKSL